MIQILKCLVNMGDKMVIGCNFEKEYSRRFYFHDYEKIFAQVGVRVAEKWQYLQPGHAMTHLVRVKKLSKIAFITGVAGQDGSYLAELLLGKGYEVHGLIRRTSLFATDRVDHLLNDGNFFTHYGDLTDTTSLMALLTQIKPTEIYNLGAQSHVAVSFGLPEYTANVDALGTHDT